MTSTARVTLSAISEWSDTDHISARELSEAVYPPDEFSDWPGQHVQWASAQYAVRVVDRGRLVSFTGIVLRDAQHEGQPVRIGGVGGVKTHPAARHHGYATLGLKRAAEFFREQKDVPFGLLVCEPHLIPYYRRLDWQVFEGKLLTEQHRVSVEFTFNRVMVLDVHTPAPTSGTIDLQGRPW